MIQVTRTVAAASLALLVGCGSSNGTSADLSSPDLGRHSLVFVTSMMFNGNFGGVTGADTICLDVAQVAGLPGHYVAWMSDSATDAISRLSSDIGPWERLDGYRVITSLSELTGDLQAPIDVDETGTRQVGNDVWTGTAVGGTSIGDPQKTCLDWTQSGMNNTPPVPMGTSGSTNNKDDGWTNNSVRPCDVPQAIYCIEQ